MDLRQDNSYLIVAERTNTNGSRQFKRLLQADDWDGLVSMARDEMREGSHVLDVCVDFVGRDGVRDMHEVVKRYVNSKPGVPLMLDSTNPAVMEAGLKLAGGRCILNSMNLEDGEEKLADICQLATQIWRGGRGRHDRRRQAQRHGPHGASARFRSPRASAIWRDQTGLRDEDLMFDPLVLPISTGIEEDRRNAWRPSKAPGGSRGAAPKCHTVVGPVAMSASG